MSQEKNKKQGFSETQTAGNGKLAVIRVRGIVGLNRDIDRTLRQLNLYKKNYCVIVPNNAPNIGMVRKVKDYITWGEIDDNIYNLLIEKKGEEYKGRISDSKGKVKYNRFLKVKDKKIKKYFRLNSPRKGYGRKGIKVPFSKGGALGHREDKIKDLIKRMI